MVVEIVSNSRKTGTIPSPVQAGNLYSHQTLIHSKTTSRIRPFIFEYHKEGTTCTSKLNEGFIEERIF